MKKTKKILSILLSCLMLMSLLSIGVFADGSQEAPINANDKWFGYGVDCYLLNTNLTAGDTDGVWYQLTADTAGILHLENSYKDVDYQIYAWVNGMQYTIYADGTYYRPIATYPVAAGDVITIQVIAWDTSLGGTVYLSAKFIDGSNDINQMVKVKAAPAKLYVGAGQTVFFQDDSLNADYATKYVTLAGDSVKDVTLYTAAANTAGVVTKQKSYKDTDNDGVIETRLGGSEGSAGSPAVKPAWAIENNSDEDRCFVLSVVDAAHECVYDNAADADCNTCGAIRDLTGNCEHDYFTACDTHCMLCGEMTRPDATHNVVYAAAKEATCEYTGNIEHWYCDVCHAVWMDAECTDPSTEGEVTLPKAHEYYDDCETACYLCGEERQAPHNLKHYDAVIPATCLETGNPEYWLCKDCKLCFVTADLSQQMNPSWIKYNGDHVRPEGSAPCATVKCELCGEEDSGEACDRGDAPACQDTPCTVCGTIVPGWGCNYNNGDEEVPAPLCQPGNCAYCGTHYEKLYDCENGSFAPCSYDGECGYGCGKQYPATGIHQFEEGITSCEGGLCQMCWVEIEGACTYDNDYDVDCNLCGAIREAKSIVQTFGGNSISEDINGLAFRFDVTNANLIKVDDTNYTIDYANSTVAPTTSGTTYKLIAMGAVVSNNNSETYLENVASNDRLLNIVAENAFGLDEGTPYFCIRITNIPDDQLDTVITARPYFIYENELGEQITVHGDEQAATYNNAAAN